MVKIYAILAVLLTWLASDEIMILADDRVRNLDTAKEAT